MWVRLQQIIHRTTVEPEHVYLPYKARTNVNVQPYSHYDRVQNKDVIQRNVVARLTSTV